jgi:hypothetical protein
MEYDLGYIDLEEKPAARQPFGPKSVTYVSGDLSPTASLCARSRYSVVHVFVNSQFREHDIRTNSGLELAPTSKLKELLGSIQWLRNWQVKHVGDRSDNMDMT